jgi:hypothetical protein
MDYTPILGAPADPITNTADRTVKTEYVLATVGDEFVIARLYVADYANRKQFSASLHLFMRTNESGYTVEKSSLMADMVRITTEPRARYSASALKAFAVKADTILKALVAARDERLAEFVNTRAAAHVAELTAKAA